MYRKPRGVVGDSTVGHAGYYPTYSLMLTDEPELPVSLQMLFLPAFHPLLFLIWQTLDIY